MCDVYVELNNNEKELSKTVNCSNYIIVFIEAETARIYNNP